MEPTMRPAPEERQKFLFHKQVLLEEIREDLNKISIG
jgi:hypothetical protein